MKAVTQAKLEGQGEMFAKAFLWSIPCAVVASANVFFSAPWDLVVSAGAWTVYFCLLAITGADTRLTRFRKKWRDLFSAFMPAVFTGWLIGLPFGYMASKLMSVELF